MTDFSSLLTYVLGGGGLITALIALFSARSNKDKTNSETYLNIANAQQSRENLHQSRETFLRDEMDKVHSNLQKEINNLKKEVSSLRVLIESHVPWDWEVVRQLKLAGIDFRDPPTLNYIKENVGES